MKKTGKPFENEVFTLIKHLVKKNQFLIGEPNLKVLKRPKYYSKDREASIECDISIEKYFADYNRAKDLRPSIIVVIECKDYSGAIPVDDVEEFHAKLQQIGADNTKGIIITRNGYFQKSALTYGESKGIALARILPKEQIHFILYSGYGPLESNFSALTKANYESSGRSFFSSNQASSLKDLLSMALDIPQCPIAYSTTSTHGTRPPAGR